jgi:cytidylate kinase
MAVVTIRGQLGSGAPDIGKLIAEKLHADYVDREIIERVAGLLERRNQDVIAKEMPAGSFLGRVAQALRHVYTIPGSRSSVVSPVYFPVEELPLNDTRYLQALKSVITELAMDEAIVIRGRGSQFILKNWPGALHVFVVSPLKIRIRRVMDDMKIDEESARNEIERFDSSRRQFIKTYFKSDLEDPLNYDLVINTEHLSFEAAAIVAVNALPLKSAAF